MGPMLGQVICQYLHLIISLVGHWFGYSIFKITGRELQIFMNKVKIASSWNNKQPEGLIIGRYYIGYINKSTMYNGELNIELSLFTKKSFYNNYVNNDNGVNNGDKCKSSLKTIEPNKKFTYYEREGSSFWRLNYGSRNLNCTKLIPRKDQLTIVNSIISDYKKRKHNVTLLSGEPGKGKSMIPYFVINKLLTMENTYKKVSLVDTFNPTHPGDSFGKMYNNISPTESEPLIIVLEEVDILIWNIHYKTVQHHKDLPIQILSKTEWDWLLDMFDRQHYNNVILIMTTNKSIEFFNDLDKCYMRDCRVNTKFVL
jgi:hypothetical protein